MIKHRLKVIEILQENPNTFTYYLECPKDLEWIEGANIHLGLSGFDEGEMPNKSLVHHMTIMTMPKEKKIGITTRIVEPLSVFKENLSKVKIGDEMTIFKIGSRMEIKREDKPLVLVSMGVAIATTRPMIVEYLDNKENISKVTNLNIDSSERFIYKDELDKLENETYKNYWAKSRTEFYENLKETLNDSDSAYYIVGSNEFLKDIIKYLKNNNVEDVNIILDKREEHIQEYLKIN